MKLGSNLFCCGCNLEDGIVASTMLVGDLADIMTVRLEDAVSCCPEGDRPL